MLLQSLLLSLSLSADSTCIVPLARVLERVRAHHPLVAQARAGVRAAEAERRIARGAYDPMISVSLDRKNFRDVRYFDYRIASLTMPTPVGVDIKLGYERTTGSYISPDRRTPARGLATLGLSVPFGNRILVDERRIGLSIADAGHDIALADLDAVVNRVLLDATRDYAKWLEATQRASMAREGVALAEARLRFTRSRVAAGDAAAIDTIEAGLEAERRALLLVDAEQALRAARLQVSLHLWSADGRASPLAEHAVPMPAADAAKAPVADSATIARTHPDARRARARSAQASAQWRVAASQRIPLPTLDVATLADAGDAELAQSLADGGGGSFKLGTGWKLPLLALKERGRLSVASARREQAVAELGRSLRNLATAAEIATTELAAARRAHALQRSIVERTRLLMQGEQRRFEAGEGTLFLVTSRERAMLDEIARLAQLEARVTVATGEVASLASDWQGLLSY